MSWNKILDHDQVIDRFRETAKRGRLASTYLFAGPEGVGKRTFALELSKALLCENRTDETLDACGTCVACQQVNSLSHPDLEYVCKPADKSFIPIELFIGDRDHRMRDGLCHRIALKPFRGGRKIAIIDDADYLNAEGANCLLKTLEEPPPKSVLILLSTNPFRQLPTIRSRSQLVRFLPLRPESVQRLLIDQGVVEDEQQAAELARRSSGSLELAQTLADPELESFRQDFCRRLESKDTLATNLARVVGEFVDQAGRDAPSRRARMKNIVDFAAEFYREQMQTACVASNTADETTRQVAEAAADCLDRCVTARTEVESNANQSTLLECWLDDLFRLRP